MLALLHREGVRGDGKDLDSSFVLNACFSPPPTPLQLYLASIYSQVSPPFVSAWLYSLSLKPV